MPTLTKPKPPAGRLWRFINGLSDPPAVAGWSPRVGDVERSDHPGIAWLASVGAMSKFVIDAGADDGRATTSDERRARTDELARQFDAENRATDPAITLPTTIPAGRRVVNVAPVFASGDFQGGYSHAVTTVLGGIYDSESPIVKNNPAAFRPADEAA